MLLAKMPGASTTGTPRFTEPLVPSARRRRLTTNQEPHVRGAGGGPPLSVWEGKRSRSASSSTRPRDGRVTSQPGTEQRAHFSSELPSGG